MKTEVKASSKLKPRGPYSLGIVSNGPFLFVSGIGPVDFETQTFIQGTFEEEADLTFSHLNNVVEAAGGSLVNAVKVNVYLSDMQHFETMNKVFQRYFSEPFPARTTVQSNLPGFSIEVDAIVALSA